MTNYQKSNIIHHFKILNHIIKREEIEVNPFDTKYFAQLTGSAQLEGSTISLGETVDLLTKDIYPDKSAKEIQMVKNINEAMHYSLDIIDKDLDEEIIK